MTEKTLTPADAPTISTAGQPLATYETPTLVSYGSLFVETAAKTPCTDPKADAGHSDFCDPDGGTVDGPK